MMVTASEAICEISDINSELPITDVVTVKNTAQVPVKKDYVINTLDHLRAIGKAVKSCTHTQHAHALIYMCSKIFFPYFYFNLLLSTFLQFYVIYDRSRCLQIIIIYQVNVVC